MPYPAVPRPRSRRARCAIPTAEAIEPRLLLSTYTVTNLNDSGPGSLRDAVGQANADAGADTIDFAAGLSGTLSLTSGSMTIIHDLSIQGPGSAVLTLTGPNGIFQVLNGNVSISQMGMTGVGVQHDVVSNNSLGVVTLSSINFFDNHTDAIGNFNRMGTVAVDDCAITDDTVAGPFPGGIFNDGIVTVSGCTFSGNTSTDDAGAIDNGGRLTVTSSTFLNNSTTRINSSAAPGGAIHSGTATNGLANVSAVLIGDTFLNNSSSGRGGAIGSGFPGGTTDPHATMLIANCTFTGNSAQSGGPALTNGGSLTVTNTTIANNTSGFGAALENVGSATINDSIVAANFKSGGTPADIFVLGTHTVTGSNNLIGTGGSGGLVNGVNGNIVGVADPKLGPLGNYGGPTQTIPLLPGSPALDSGANALAIDGSGNALTSDQRGLPRIFNGTVDIGAYEAQPPALAGDVNHDGTTNFSDLLLLAQHYGSNTQPMWEGGDLTGDGSVAFADLLVLAQNYGKPATGASVSAVAAAVNDLITLRLKHRR